MSEPYCLRCAEPEGGPAWAVRLVRIHAALDSHRESAVRELSRFVVELACFCAPCREATILAVLNTRHGFRALRAEGASLDEAERITRERLSGGANA